MLAKLKALQAGVEMSLWQLSPSLWSFCMVPSAWWGQSRETSNMLAQHAEGMSHNRKSQAEGFSFSWVCLRNYINRSYCTILVGPVTSPSRFKGKGNWFQILLGDLGKILDGHMWTGQFATLQLITFIWIPVSSYPSTGPIKSNWKKLNWSLRS